MFTSYSLANVRVHTCSCKESTIGYHKCNRNKKMYARNWRLQDYPTQQTNDSILFARHVNICNFHCSWIGAVLYPATTTLLLCQEYHIALWLSYVIHKQLPVISVFNLYQHPQVKHIITVLQRMGTRSGDFKKILSTYDVGKDYSGLKVIYYKTSKSEFCRK